MNKQRTGRKPKPEAEKVKQKKVYISDNEEKKILKQTRTTTLTEAVKSLIA